MERAVAAACRTRPVCTPRTFFLTARVCEKEGKRTKRFGVCFGANFRREGLVPGEFPCGVCVCV